MTDTDAPTVGSAGPLVERVRAELPVLRRCHYLNTGLFGPLPRAAAEAANKQQRRDVERGRSGTRYFQEYERLLADARGGLAAAIGASPAHVALTRSTTEACHIVVKGLGIGPGDEVVTTDIEH